uniref:Reverse transcriptase domain-containing protein n=1 Tax=Tanacetum cinerariifolium TaxID=118510 RepID=A0A6L2LLW0_TANCI|nr:hypothetical protein [Tanacetum cinerariifolium]
MVLVKDFATFMHQEMKIHPLLFLIRTLSMILHTFSPTLHNPSMRHTRASYVGTILTLVIIVHHGSRLAMCRNRATIKTLVIIVIHNNIFTVQTVGDLMKVFNESINPLNEIILLIPPSNAIIPVLPTFKDLEDSLIMGKEELNNIPKMESDEFIKSSVEDLVPIQSESKDTSEDDSERVLPLCDDFSPINISKGKPVTFSKSLFDSNDDFTSSDDESLFDEDILEDNVQIHLNPIFEFNDEYIFSGVNPLFNEVLENIENKD